MTRFIHVEFEDGVGSEYYDRFSDAAQEMAQAMMTIQPAGDATGIWVTGSGAVETLKPELPGQPPMGGFCDSCGHFAYRHEETGCKWEDRPCACTGMLWNGHRWPRPWLAAPEGLRAE